MGNSFSDPGDFRIEISGWGLDNTFFVERTYLLWSSEGTKQVQLHRALSEGAMVFIRLLASEPSSGSVPAAYQVEEVGAMDCSGRCRMRLAQMHPRSKESPGRKNASNRSEDSKRVCGVQEQETVEELQYQEVLQ